MDFSFASAISASGMEVERARLDVAAINLANMHTTRTAGGGQFRPLRAIVSSDQFFSNVISNIDSMMVSKPIVSMQETNVPPRLAYEPNHPDADKKGFVAYPGVDSVTEMVNLMTAVRAYEANVVAMNAAKSMALKALEIGGNS